MLSVEDMLGIGRERGSHDKFILAYSDGWQEGRGGSGTTMGSTKTLHENVTYDVFRVQFSVVDQQQRGDSHFGQQSDRYVMVWEASYRTFGLYRRSHRCHTRAFRVLRPRIRENDWVDDQCMDLLS
jgi:hypothetical protein